MEEKGVVGEKRGGWDPLLLPSSSILQWAARSPNLDHQYWPVLALHSSDMLSDIGRWIPDLPRLGPYYTSYEGPM